MSKSEQDNIENDKEEAGGFGGGGVLNLPNWFRILWWVVTLVGLLSYLGLRFDDLRHGHARPDDVVVFLVLMCVWLLPLANEINLFGIKLKRQVEEMRRDLSGQITALKSEIKVSNSMSSQVHLWGAPPSEYRIRQLLPKLEAEVERIDAKQTPTPSFEVSSTVSDLFGIRYNLEMELRRVFSERFPDRELPTRVYDLRRELLSVGVLNKDVAQGFKDVYSTCNAAIHGRKVDDKQIAFAKLSGIQLLRILKNIHADPDD